MSHSAFPLSTKTELACHTEKRASEMWLGGLTPIKWVTVFGSTVLSA
jgi:hypothetical protein